MDKATQRKDWLLIGPKVAPFPMRDAGRVAGAPLATAQTSFPAVADSPVPPPPGLFARTVTAQRVANTDDRPARWVTSAALCHPLAPGRRSPASPATTSGTLPTDTVSFGALVLGTILIVGAFNLLPALALGPVVEALQR